MEYQDFLNKKLETAIDSGFEIGIEAINPLLYDFQKDIVAWALKKGKAAIFADCGLGKTAMQLEWSNHVHHQKTGGDILILAPLAVSMQTKLEGKKFGIEVNLCREKEDIKHGINITNYERIHKFNPSDFIGIVLDESSILKSYSGKIKNEIIDSFSKTPYKLACSATPAPNDFAEIGNHAEFLNVMSRPEMLSTYFIHDSQNTSKWRLKGHVKDNIFWQWMRTWSVMITNPSDMGYNDDRYILPGLKYHEHIIKTDTELGELFCVKARSLMDRRRARRSSLESRVEKAVEVINSNPNEQYLVWCELNDESNLLTKMIENSVEIKGADKTTHKENSMIAFSENEISRLVTKPKIAGHGMNWQQCSNMIFVGLSDSYESIYQAIRRCYRFGQTKEVNVHIILSDVEGSIMDNVKRKEEDHKKMIAGMVENMKTPEIIEHTTNIENETYVSKEDWTIYNSDCVQITDKMEYNSIDYTIFSPPFSSLYTYSDSMQDMGNSRSDEEFNTHFKFLLKNLYRITKPGRIVSIHCMDLPAMKERDGFIGVKDFSGDLIRMCQEIGFIFHSRCTIWKDPLIEAVRTKAIGLMHKQVVKDSCRSRQGLPDYLISFVKMGENKEPVSHSNGFSRFIGVNKPTQKGLELSHNIWRRYASPVWMDINQTNTLNKNLARENNDERHICPLQLDVIGRGIELWSNKGDTVFSPFAGIGSEGYVALEMKRKFIGVELKKSYFDLAVNNLNSIINQTQMSLFS